MRIAFVHYHVKSGGVTRVMENALSALGKSVPNIDAVVLSGTKPPEDCVLPCKVVEGIGYAGASEYVEPKTLADRMQESARSFLGADPDVWHIHNHSLGKNPAMADAVIELAERGCRILLQIHDFAEDGRPDSYRLREDHLEAKSCYPVSDNIQYAVLNRRDYLVLKTAGIPESLITWLPNPVHIRDLEYDEDSGKNQSLDETILYPVRAVRRKNLGELLLHASLPSKKRSYVTTLGTTSQDFVNEYRQWRDFSDELGLNVNFEVVESYGLSFDSLIDHSHCIITTSVAEGFGLGFIEPWVFGKSLMGRDLPEITADFKELGVIFNKLYESIPIPVTLFKFDEFKTRLERIVNSYHERYGVTLEGEWLDRWLKESVIGRNIDFAKLDEIAQREVIECVQSDYNLQSMIQSQFSYEPEQSEIVDHNASVIERKLNINNYGHRLKEVYEALLDRNPGGSLTYAESGKVLNSFFSVERFLPLRA